MKIHICLVSAQAAANLLPALDAELKPDLAVLVVSTSMTRQAGHLSAVLNEVGIKSERLALEDEHDFEPMQESLMQFAARHENDEVALNLTGGTKLMALAAQSVAALAQWKMFYIDADTDQLTWLGAGKSHRQALNEQLRLRHYLRGYGFTIGEEPVHPQLPPAQQILTETLIRQIGSLETSLAQLNWLAQQAEDRRQLTVKLDDAQRDSLSLHNLLRQFSDADVLSEQNGTLRFRSDEARTFVKGGWLEAHVFRTLSGLTAPLGIRDKAANLQVIDDSGVKNELDAVFIARNRLFVIECKTARMDRPEAPKANDTLFKLAENCRRIGGIGTRRMLVSYRALREPEKKLAKALDIELVCGAEIAQLTEKLKIWVKPK